MRSILIPLQISKRGLGETSNPKDAHGETSKLSPEEIKDLAEYVLSL